MTRSRLRKQEWLCSLTVLVLATSVIGAAGLSAPLIAHASTGDVTMAAFGHKVVPAGSHGDTWDSTWLANGKQITQINDGTGFGGTYVSDRIAEIIGTPESPSTLAGTNLNPGTLGNFLGGTYSTSVYEVDGALYHIVCYSDQIPGAWVFRNASMMKSTDGGATWVNTSGGVNTRPADSASASTFPDGRWGEVNFVKYGQGGEAPNVDNAQTYAYLSNQNGVNNSDYYLARVRRSDLSAWTSTFDRTKIQYYKGGDGLLDASWSANISETASIYNYPNRVSPTAIVYNASLGRYIATPFNSDSFLNPPVHSSVRVMQALHPWGPWTDVLDENLNTKEADNLTWSFLTQKYTSADGLKMWMSTSGRAPYGLQLLPVYLTTNPVQKLEAENAGLTGTSVSTSTPGYSATGYVAGLDTTGDQVQFNANVATAGAYMFKLRYHTTASTNISWYVNGYKQDQLAIGESEQTYATWTDMSMFAWLGTGNNTISYKMDAGDTGNVDLDNLSLALYSTTPDSLPGAHPPTGETILDDNATGVGIAYTGAWTLNPSATGYYANTNHWAKTPGNKVEFPFTGTQVTWTGAKNNDHGKADVYIDGVLDATIDTYDPAYLKQLVLYTKTGLSPGAHTLRVQVRSDKNAASSDYYTDIDSFVYQPSPAVVPTIDDVDSRVAYNGTWAANGTTSSGYYNETMHYSQSTGSNAVFSFSGTAVYYFGAVNTDHGKVDVYVDGVLDQTVDTYSASYQKQQLIYSKTGLSSGVHTLKIQIRSDKNASSSGYYTDVDGFMIQ